MAMKNTTEAARAYQKATDLDPNCAVSILDNRGRLHDESEVNS